MEKKKILFICGSLNQTSMMHQISRHFQDYDCYFTPYYADGFINYVVSKGYLNFSILNGPFRRSTEKYLRENNLEIDYRGLKHDYDLVYTCADLIYPKNIRDKKVILVQEGMTDPENIMFYLVKYLKIPRWLASTSTMGMSHMYDLFCVASYGYKDFFVKRKEVKPEKIVVTGIPNFDNLNQYLD
ncbi:MAG: glycosyltransferase family 4 protein, partial [Ignavibacteria bacterium]|nr:glycosyltransferase family 4 protein [Ignavibacteria bacterium]